MKKGPKRDWAERAARRAAFNSCAHMTGHAPCESCLVKRLSRIARGAEKRGYERGRKDQAEWRNRMLLVGATARKRDRSEG